MKRLLQYVYKNKVILAAASFLVVALLSSVVFAAKPAQASSGNDMVNGGVGSPSELCYQYSHNSNIRAIMNHFGVNGCASGLVSGEVRSNGDVYVGGKRVAAGAMSAGRHNIPGSTPVPGLGIFVRPTHVSFNSASLSAFVKMENG